MTSAESLSGRDALLLHLEQADSPMHTLKVVVLDTSRRGRPVTLEEMQASIGERLGLVRRSTQKIVAAPGFGGIPFWVDDPDFDLSAHLDERTLDAPGTMAQLDEVCTELSMAHLSRHQALWSMTLVHGLEGGRQAVVARVHHAVTDGLGALNTFIAATTDEPGQVIPPRPAAAAPAVDYAGLRRAALVRLGRLASDVPNLAATGVAGLRRTRAFRREHPDLPPFLGSKRNFCNAPSGHDRLCATGSLPLADVKALAKATGVTVNGALHGILAGALRAETIARGEPLDRPAAASFGIAEDARDRSRLYGNAISPTNVGIFTNVEDPLDRLRRTAASCREGVELRRLTGVEMAERWSSYGPRFVSLFRRTMANRLPWIVNHVITANVAGPDHQRWLGEIEVVDWFSFALTLNPANVNITAHSYAGRINIGLISTPEALPDPAGFLDRMSAELLVLLEAAGLSPDQDGLPTSEPSAKASRSTSAAV